MLWSAARRWVAVAVATVLVSAGVADVAAATVGAGGDGAAAAPVDASQLPGLESEVAPRVALSPLLGGGTGDVPPTVSRADDPDALVADGRADRGSSFDEDLSIRVDGLTTATQEVFKNPDGTFMARVASTPVRFQDDTGAWNDIDLAFAEDASGALRAKASGLPVVIAADASSDLVRVGVAQGTIGMGVPDVARDLGPVETNSGRAVFAPRGGSDADPTVRVDLTVGGFEQDMVLPSTDGPASYRVPFTLPEGVDAKQGVSGVDFIDAAGVAVASFGGGVAYDSMKDGIGGRSSSTGVSTRLFGVEGRVATVEVAVDPAWMRDGKRVAPIVIDPYFIVGNSPTVGEDTHVQNGVTTPQGSNPDMASGFSGSFGVVAHSLIKFDLSAYLAPNRWVTAARMHVFNKLTFADGPGCTAQPTSVYGVGEPWSASASVWPGPGTDGWFARSTKSFPTGQPASCGAGWVIFDDPGITTMAREWLGYVPANPSLGIAGQGLPNYGFLLQGDEANLNINDAFKVFASGNDGSGRAPYLEVFYTSVPDNAAPISPPDGARWTTPTPTLSVSPATDPDGDPVQYLFRVATGPDANSAAIVAQSSWQAGTSWPVPANTLVNGQTYYWQAWTYDGNSSYRIADWTRKFTFDARLGVSGPSPIDTFGPASVNLATGNVAVATGSPTFATVGGNIGLSYTYNSSTPTVNGLQGSYFNGKDANGPTGPAKFIRNEAPISFDWGTSAPAPWVAADNFAARWEGYIQVPQTGSWELGASSDDGVRIWVDTGSGYGAAYLDKWGGNAGGGVAWTPGTGAVSLNANQRYRIKIEYWDQTGPASVQVQARCTSCSPTVPAGIIPASWFSTTNSALSPGWTMNADVDGAIAYQSINTSATSAVLKKSDGATESWAWSGSGWRPPPGDDGTLVGVPGGEMVLTDGDGQIYTFNIDGTLRSVVSALDDKKPAAATYNWSANPPRLTAITDPVSSRAITLTYKTPGSNNCPDGSALGFDAQPPEHMLCKTDYTAFGSGETKLFYSAGQLARLEDPGGEVTDFAYTGGKLVAVRDPLAADAVAAGVRTNDDTTRTLITYDGTGRAASVTLAKPLATTPGNERPKHTYNYTSATVTGVDRDVAGTPQVDRTVTFDESARLTRDTDATGKYTDTVWDGVSDRVTSTTDAAGLRSTTIYDTRERPIEQYGPAPTAWFGTDNKPLAGYVSQVPKSTTTYDQNVVGLAANYFPNKDLLADAGPDAQVHATGVGTGDGSLDVDWGAGQPAGLPSANNGDNWSARYSGDITFPDQGIYSLKVGASDDQGVRLAVDDRQLIDTWAGDASPDAAVWNNELHLAVRAADSSVWHRWQNTVGGWESESLGGQAIGDVSIVSRDANNLDVFVRGTDDQLWHKWRSPSGWSHWEALGGSLTSGVDATLWAGQLHIVGRGIDGVVMHKWWVPVTGWSGWENLAGNIIGDPTITAYGTQLSIFGRGAGNDHLMHRWYNGSWQAWQDLGGTLASSPDATQRNTGGSTSLHVLARDANNDLYHQWYLGGWSSQTLTEGDLTVAPGAIGWPSGRLDVFGEGTDSRITQKIFVPGYNVWLNWAAIGDGTRVGAINITADKEDKPLRIRLETTERTGSANLQLRWDPPGAPTEAIVPGSQLNARYGLTTTTVDPDGKTSSTTYADPAMSMPTASTEDPGGLALTPSTGYETPGTNHYLRRVSRTLPAGNTWTYSYYGADGVLATADDPCMAGTQTVNQAGGQYKRTGPDPDGAGPGTAMVEESVDDVAGRPIANRIGSEPWACTTYDTRGREATKAIPAYGAEPARTITRDYAVSGNPLVTSVTDPAGTITTTTDLLGRVVSYTDVWAKTTTTTYDQAGRVAQTVTPSDTMTYEYDAAGRVEKVRLAGSVLADPVYDSAGRLTTVAYPSGAGNAGNATALAPITRDALGRTTGLSWTGPGGTLTSNTVTRSLQGRVVDDATDGVDPWVGTDNYTYDGAGRLTQAMVPGHALLYPYAPSGGCGPSTGAGKNTNRTQFIDYLYLSATSCYDNADRLTSTTTPGMGTLAYDSHGNTTTLGGQSMGYDGADRHVTTDGNGVTLRYARDATDRIVSRVTWSPSPITFRADAANDNGTGSTSLTLNRPAGTQANDTLIAQVTAAGGTGTTITTPTGWTLIATTTNGTNVRTSTYRHLAAGGDPANWVWTLSGSKPAAGGIAAYTGVDTTNPIDATASATANATTSHVAPTVTTTAWNDLHIAVHGLTTATTVTPTAGATERHDRASAGTTPVTAELADTPLTGPGATGTRSAISAGAASSASQTITLRPASTPKCRCTPTAATATPLTSPTGSTSRPPNVRSACPAARWSRNAPPGSTPGRTRTSTATSPPSRTRPESNKARRCGTTPTATPPQDSPTTAKATTTTAGSDNTNAASNTTQASSPLSRWAPDSTSRRSGGSSRRIPSRVGPPTTTTMSSAILSTCTI